MQRLAIIGKYWRKRGDSSRFLLQKVGSCPLFFARLMAAVILLLPSAAVAAPAAEKIIKIAVFPTAPYYIYIVYESLAVFWVAILGLLVIIRMKIREIERVQALGVEKEDQDAPLLK